MIPSFFDKLRKRASPPTVSNKSNKTGVFFADPMDYTPFSKEKRETSLETTQLISVDSPAESEVIVARKFGNLAPFLATEQELFVWTHEPAFCTTNAKVVTDTGTGRRISIMNAINGEIYVSPLYYYHVNLDKMTKYRADNSRRKTCSFLGTYRQHFDRYSGDENIDLCNFRQNLALSIQKIGHCDIFGKGWPDGIKIVENSRSVANYASRKSEILRDYKFNIAIENTSATNYVTEKFWQALEMGCVPIYFAKGSGITSVVSESSFIDASSYKSMGDLIEVMLSMTDAERSRILASAYEDCAKLDMRPKKPTIASAMVERFEQRVFEALGRVRN
ncbi:MAG: hypothetical protein HY834_07195 [Devosia nanyangense]|uniref:Fucosyltransferase C-terminal domain-containing protein n=1 Tax=Devosia nanyangense TaxID=1228055 RepID=A0A933L3B4_9HYPH|nr:hypothetical protein [Devosia nanyangense]